MVLAIFIIPMITLLLAAQAIVDIATMKSNGERTRINQTIIQVVHKPTV